MFVMLTEITKLSILKIQVHPVLELHFPEYTTAYKHGRYRQ